MRDEANKPPVVAIDGPSASGKGTVAQRVARELGFHCLDSGTLYRLVALTAQKRGVALDDETALAALAQGLQAQFQGEEVLMDGVRVTDQIRSETCAADASKVAAFPKVRLALLGKQRAFRKPPGLVAEGRDMSSTVFPDARLKVFLTASPEARAARRYKQLIEKGMCASISTLLQEIKERDARDSERPVAPLRRNAGAGLLDSTALSVEEVVAEVVARYRALLL
ncbi:MAG TPA: (d)CMP kinase [Burkholderiales bacterium]|nr:(d)CMP kinase [Burkholderiales bacterium]